MVRVEIVNTGICEDQSFEYLAMVNQFNNDIVGEYFKDLRPRQRLHWKIISGNYNQIEMKDVGRFLWSYGVVIGILIARKPFKIILKYPISSVKTVQYGFIWSFCPGAE